MELEGVKVDAAALAEFAAQLAKEMDVNRKKPSTGWREQRSTWNSPKQSRADPLRHFEDRRRAGRKPRPARHSTDEQTLAVLANDHEIVRCLMEFRVATKLKSTYADALPTTIWPATARVHTTYNQVMTTTGRL